jgi:guanine nucleotide-binding protein G(i) subunit alpha
MLNLRIPTQAISDTVLKIQHTKFHFFDVSGLKHHRSYWVPYFQNATTIVFVVSLSSYNQNMIEDPTMNRMADSIVLFDHIGNHDLLKHTNIVLFLNKRDIYGKKVKKIPIETYFPDYNGK